MGVSVMIFTHNEEIHIPRCLEALRWCDDVVVVDSFSTDRTVALCHAKNVRVVQHQFSSMWEQRNWALDTVATKHGWVLILDADELVPPELADEIRRVVAGASRSSEIAAYHLRRRFHFWGRWLKHSSLYPTWLIRLIRKDRVRFHSVGHGEGQDVHGATGSLENDLIDENLKGIDGWFERQNRYSRKDADHELQLTAMPIRWRDVASSDPLTRRQALKRVAMNLPGRALIYFLYTYLLRGGILDGRDGLMFCVMRALYQEMVVIKRYDRLRAKESGMSTKR